MCMCECVSVGVGVYPRLLATSPMSLLKGRISLLPRIPSEASYFWCDPVLKREELCVINNAGWLVWDTSPNTSTDGHMTFLSSGVCT